MEDKILSWEKLEEFAAYLRDAEKSTATQEKYLHDVRELMRFAQGQPITKEQVLNWKKRLAAQSYAVRSINSMLAAVNCLLEFLY